MLLANLGGIILFYLSSSSDRCGRDGDIYAPEKKIPAGGLIRLSPGSKSRPRYNTFIHLQKEGTPSTIHSLTWLCPMTALHPVAALCISTRQQQRRNVSNLFSTYLFKYHTQQASQLPSLPIIATTTSGYINTSNTIKLLRAWGTVSIHGGSDGA